MSDNKNKNRLSTAGNGANSNQTPAPTPIMNQASTIGEKKTDDVPATNNVTESGNFAKSCLSSTFPKSCWSSSG